MSAGLADEERQIVEAVARWVDREVRPQAGRLEREQQYPAGTQGAGMITSVKFEPFTVSFARLNWKEIAGPPSNMKCYFTKVVPPSTSELPATLSVT